MVQAQPLDLNLLGPVRWRGLGVLAALLGAPTLLLVHPRPTLIVFAFFAALFGARALWRSMEPVPPALGAPDRLLGLPVPSGDAPPLRPGSERLDAAGYLRALRRSLGLAQTYASTAMTFLVLAGGTHVAAMVVESNVDAGVAGAVYYTAVAFLVAAVSLGTAGVALMVRDSRREARESELDR